MKSTEWVSKTRLTTVLALGSIVVGGMFSSTPAQALTHEARMQLNDAATMAAKELRSLRSEFQKRVRDRMEEDQLSVESAIAQQAASSVTIDPEPETMIAEISD